MDINNSCSLISLGQLIPDKTIALIPQTQCCLLSTKTCFFKLSNKDETKYDNQKALNPSFLTCCLKKKRFQAFAVATFSLSWFGIKFKLVQVVAAYFSFVLL